MSENDICKENHEKLYITVFNVNEIYMSERSIIEL